MQQVRQPVYQLEGVVHVVEVIATWSHGPVPEEGIHARLRGALCVLHTEATQSNNKPQRFLYIACLESREGGWKPGALCEPDGPSHGGE